MIPKYDESEFIEDLIQPISDIYQETNSKVLSIMVNRIKQIGTLSPTDAGRLSILLKNQDLKQIEKVLSDATNLSINQIDSIVEESATYNDDLSEKLYKAKNMPPATFATDSALLSVVDVAKKNIVDSVVNLSKTTGFMINGKMTSVAKTYNYAVNRATFEVQQGLFDFNTSLRSVIKELAESGIRTVDFESGYSRRLDSQARLNLHEGISRLNTEYRQMQGDQFGADGIELSAHALSEPIHGMYQGKQYSNKEFEQIQNSLQRKFFTNNCRHSSFPIILGISEPAYSDKELQQYKDNSNKQVEYTTKQKDSNGNYIKKTVPKYEMSQVLRKTETEIRRLKDVKNQFDIMGDKGMIQEYNKKISAKTKYYKQIASETGLETKMDRLRVYGPSGPAKPKEILKRTPKIIPEPPKNITQETKANLVEPSKLRKALEDSGVQYREVERLPRKLSSDEIIERLGGGDMTGGSCSSLGFAYIGNKAGLDVLDFRGGTSREFFSRDPNIQEMLGLEGVKGKVVKVQKEIAGTMELMRDLEPGKEYYLSVGRHAAIIRRTETGAEYLELQSKLKNGWTSFHNADYGSTSDTLFKRFGCRKTVDKMKVGSTSMIFEKPVVLIDVDSLQGNEEFRKILGYINTSASMQKKGVLGGVK